MGGATVPCGCGARNDMGLALWGDAAAAAITVEATSAARAQVHGRAAALRMRRHSCANTPPHRLPHQDTDALPNPSSDAVANARVSQLAEVGGGRATLSRTYASTVAQPNAIATGHRSQAPPGWHMRQVAARPQWPRWRCALAVGGSVRIRRRAARGGARHGCRLRSAALRLCPWPQLHVLPPDLPPLGGGQPYHRRGSDIRERFASAARGQARAPAFGGARRLECI